MQYFAYGSNMSLLRLRQRVPSARVLSVARLYAHCLRFHKAGSGGSAKCDASMGTRHEEIVQGVLYRMDPAHKTLE